MCAHLSAPSAVAEVSLTQSSQPVSRGLPFAFTHLDTDVRRELVYVDARDSAQGLGVLYRPAAGESKVVVYLMPPGGDFLRPSVVPPLTSRGYAVFCQNSRYLNNDTDMV